MPHWQKETRCEAKGLCCKTAAPQWHATCVEVKDGNGGGGGGERREKSRKDVENGRFNTGCEVLKCNLQRCVWVVVEKCVNNEWISEKSIMEMHWIGKQALKSPIIELIATRSVI